MSTAVFHHIIPRHRGAEAFGSLGLALLMHGFLALLLFFGIHWQSQPPAVIQAELWSAVPQVAAPAPPPPEPVIEKPVPQVQREPEPPPVKADIAIREDRPKKPVPVEKPKPELKPLPKPEPKPVPPAKPVVAEKPLKPSQSLQDLIASAGAPSNGSAPQTSGPRGDPNYAGLIQAKILSNLRFPLPPDLVGNPEARFVIEQLPSGEIVAVKKTRASGIPAFDGAVERAIEASSPLPKGKDGKVISPLELVFHPLDKN